MSEENETSPLSRSARLRKFLGRTDTIGAAFVFVMAIPNIILSFTENMGLFGSIANALFPFALYPFLLSLPKRPAIMVASLLLLVVLNMFQIVVLFLYGESIIAVDMFLNLLTTNTGEASELLTNLALPIILNMLVYLPFIGWAVYSIVKKQRFKPIFRKHLRNLGYLFGALTALFVLLAYCSFPRYAVRLDLYPVNVLCNIVEAVKRSSQTINYHKTSADFKYDAVDTRPADNREIYVLVIGETSRACNWQVMGYSRPTNPRLSVRNDLILFPRALSQSNTTYKSVPLMLTHTIPADFDSIVYRKSLITAFKEAGYYTSFFSGQSRNHALLQYFSEEADTIFYNSKPGQYDMSIVRHLDSQLSDSLHPKQLIVLHTYGSHFNYKDRYPESFSKFKPDKSSQANKYDRIDLVNAYDNSILYTDAVLSEIIEMIDRTDAPATMIYTSDHGEDIFDDSRNRILHSSPVPTYYQLHVPLIVWQSPEYVAERPEITRALRANADKYVATSQTFFHTLLNIAGIQTPYLDPIQSVASELYSEPRPVFLNDLNRSVPLEESGLKWQDIDILRALRILQ